MKIKEMISVEIAYASQQQQKIIAIEVEVNSSLLQAIHQSQILKIFPEIDLQQWQVGVWGQVRPLTAQVNVGDRIEIYRPLLIDPKQSRLRRAKLAAGK